MFNTRTIYMNHAEALEETLMSYTRGDIESWEDALTECLYTWTDSDAQKVLSELGQDTDEDGAVNRLFFHYVEPETRDEIIKSWHEHSQYLPRETEQ